VRVADCCPVLLASADGRVVAAVHAGWRGVVSGVLPAAIASMRTLTREPVVAAIGPCISFEQFEVGDEVAAEFRGAFGPAADALIRSRGPEHPGKSLVDLKGALAEQLKLAGILEFDTDPGCTVSQPGLFYSHRRDQGVTGRMIGIIGPKG
jgi:YfiH family protein